jgi:hypothetical protein
VRGARARWLRHRVGHEGKRPTRVGLIGDMPYDGKQEKEFTRVMKDVNDADLAFVVHNGDF